MLSNTASFIRHSSFFSNSRRSLFCFDRYNSRRNVIMFTSFLSTFFYNCFTHLLYLFTAAANDAFSSQTFLTSSSELIVNALLSFLCSPKLPPTVPYPRASLVVTEASNITCSCDRNTFCTILASSYLRRDDATHARTLLNSSATRLTTSLLPLIRLCSLDELDLQHLTSLLAARFCLQSSVSSISLIRKWKQSEQLSAALSTFVQSLLLSVFNCIFF